MERKEKNAFTPYFTRKNKKGSLGPGFYDPKEIYNYLFTNTDKYGILVYSVKSLAEAVKLTQPYLTNLANNFVAAGLIEKTPPKTWRLLYKPDEIDWENEEFQELLAELRASVQYKNKQKEKK